MQRLQDPPQVPAQTVVQALPGDGQWLQHLLQAVVSAKKQNKQKKTGFNLFFKPDDGKQGCFVLFVNSFEDRWAFTCHCRA